MSAPEDAELLLMGVEGKVPYQRALEALLILVFWLWHRHWGWQGFLLAPRPRAGGFVFMPGMTYQEGK